MTHHPATYAFKALLSLAMACFAVTALADKSTAVIDDLVYLHPQKMVVVEPGRRLNLYCTGKGAPTVVFDAGLGDSTKAWGLNQPAVARATRACSYDRAGLGFSDASTRPGTSANIVADLHRLLKAADIKPPYILVGHSSGGMNLKLYAETYLSEVAGMVFVDSSHEEQAERIWQLDPDLRKGVAPALASYKRCRDAVAADFVEGSELFNSCVFPPGPRFSEAINALDIHLLKQRSSQNAWTSELENFSTVSADQLRAAYRPLGNIPIIVLTREPMQRFPKETQALRDAKNQVHVELQTHIAKMSSRGVQRIVAGASHYLQLDYPDVVNAAILEVLQAVKSGQ